MPEPNDRDDDQNPLLAAFKNQYNLIAVGTVVGFSILSGTLLPMLLAAGVELTLLPFLERYERLRRAQDRDEEAKRRKATAGADMLKALPPPEQARYRALERLAEEIRYNYKDYDSSSQLLLDELVQKLQFLLGFHLRMRYSLARDDEYFRTTDPEKLEERITMLDHEATHGPERVREIKARTRAVLGKRLERYQKALENRTVVEAQTETVEEVLRLLRDQSFSLRDPRGITEQLDGLVSAAEETERGVKDLEAILDLESEALLPLPANESTAIQAELERGRAPAAAKSQASSPAPPRVVVATPAPPPPPPSRRKQTH